MSVQGGGGYILHPDFGLGAKHAVFRILYVGGIFRSTIESLQRYSFAFSLEAFSKGKVLISSACSRTRTPDLYEREANGGAKQVPIGGRHIAKSGWRNSREGNAALGGLVKYTNAESVVTISAIRQVRNQRRDHIA